MPFLRQTWTLTKKNLLVSLTHNWASTTLRAFILPVVFMFFISYLKNFFLPPSDYGIGSPRPIRSFIDALETSSGGRDTVAFVNNGHTGGDIEALINYLSVSVRTAGKDPVVLTNEQALLTICRSSLRGASQCFGAASFHSSPTEAGTIWNYTLRADGALGSKIFVNQHDNDAETYILPFQHAIDAAIINQFNGSASGTTVPTAVNQFPFTDETQQQRADNIRRTYMNAIINFLGVAYFIGICGILYQSTGHMASERELGMSQLIEAMTPSRRRWHTQAARLIANHLAFDIIYLPGWIISGIILRALVFTNTSYGVMIVLHILAGLSLSGLSILAGSLFRKAQLSGITTIIVSLILAVIIQVAGPSSSGAIGLLTFLFPPMTYTVSIIYMAFFDRVGRPTNLVKSAPGASWELPGITFWVFLIIQALAFPVLGAIIERNLYGTASKARKFNSESSGTTAAIKLASFSKHYRPSWLRRKIAPLFGAHKRENFVAVNDLSLEVIRGQIFVLLGANGSGKSTTLDAIAGLGTVTMGEIDIDGSNGGLGMCPQKNVLWKELNVYEHVKIFNGLKAGQTTAPKEEIISLIESVDLGHKLYAKSATLSGGQMRKLNLAMMFTGDSKVCLVDEVSSGLDPISRRKIWDILIRERDAGRTFLLTTHFLDEADLLSDDIAIMSKGNLKAHGSAVELKHRLGGGYRVHINSLPDHGSENSTSKTAYSNDTKVPRNSLGVGMVYELNDSSETAGFLNEAERQGITNYTVSGPTIEDVFLKLAEEVRDDHSGQNPVQVPSPLRSKANDKDSVSEDMTEAKEHANGLDLQTGLGTSIPKQAWILFGKRFVILRRNFFPYICAVIIPVAAAGLVTFFLKGFQALSCSPDAQSSNPTLRALGFSSRLEVPIGPASRVDPATLARFSGGNASPFQVVNNFAELSGYIDQRYQDVTPGGIYLGGNGTTPTFAYIANYVLYYSVITQNLFNNILTGSAITTQYQEFAVPFAPGAGKTLQLILYFGLAMSAYPGFFVLYPTIERLRKVRALHYSNGISAAPLWLAYLCFDFLFVLLISVVCIALWLGISSIWYYPGYLFVVFFLYGLTATLFSYLVSLFAGSSLAAFAWAVGLQAALFLCSLIAYLSILTYSPVYNIDRHLRIAHFTIAIVSPSANLCRALLLTLNEFSILCIGDAIALNPAGIIYFGGPILYLIVQALVFFTALVWWDSGYKPAILQRFSKRKTIDPTEERISSAQDADIAAEIDRVDSISSGLRVEHLYKSYDGVQIVENITFDIPSSTVFALLGPNGAGKSTTISLIRGDVRPDHHGGDVLVEGVSVTSHRAEARHFLGVCPQFDAMDSMTLTEHLRFYARARGVPNPDHNIEILIQSMSLHPYRDRIAAKLSGGNKRKLSLAIALIGNPAVLLLDEPSSGMDAASKRLLWRTLEDVSKGRAMLITTHSMEEANKLATRAGIMAKKMLALGTSESLRKRFGDRWYVHLVLGGCPHVSEDETSRVKHWIMERVQGVEVEDRLWYGQLRFSARAGANKSIAGLFTLLEDNKEKLGLEYYSISQATLDQVFLEVVSRHNVEEEDNEKASPGDGRKRGFGARIRRTGVGYIVVVVWGAKDGTGERNGVADRNLRYHRTTYTTLNSYIFTATSSDSLIVGVHDTFALYNFPAIPGIYPTVDAAIQKETDASQYSTNLSYTMVHSTAVTNGVDGHTNGTNGTNGHTNGTTKPKLLPKNFDTIEDTLEAFSRGEFVVVLDSESRENEGDLIIAAEDATPAKMAFMIRYTSGYICAPVSRQRALELDLPQMVAVNEDTHRTAYTVTVDAVTPDLSTGISATDRSNTVRMLAKSAVKPEQFRRPGHILPLQARDGGIRERHGHTEAGVELCRLTGKQPASVICEMVLDGEEVEGVPERVGGGMMRRDDCLEFGRRWGLKVCTIEALVEYVERTEGKLDVKGSDY
ncbi:ABC transporter-like protein [Venturia nashicola]|nr:ABC transporter-like protein [Venturia nashicola]